MVNQMRDGIRLIIESNPVTAVCGLKSFTCKICHENAIIPSSGTSPIGRATTESLYLLCPHNATFAKGETVTAGGVKYKLGNQSEKKIEGMVYSRVFALTAVL